MQAGVGLVAQAEGLVGAALQAVPLGPGELLELGLVAAADRVEEVKGLLGPAGREQGNPSTPVVNGLPNRASA